MRPYKDVSVIKNTHKRLLELNRNSIFHLSVLPRRWVVTSLSQQNPSRFVEEMVQSSGKRLPYGPTLQLCLGLKGHCFSIYLKLFTSAITPHA